MTFMILAKTFCRKFCMLAFFMTSGLINYSNQLFIIQVLSKMENKDKQLPPITTDKCHIICLANYPGKFKKKTSDNSRLTCSFFRFPAELCSYRCPQIACTRAEGWKPSRNTGEDRTTTAVNAALPNKPYH